MPTLAAEHFYLHRAVAALASAWERDRGLHARFRRWQPGEDPTYEMRSAVQTFAPNPPTDDADDAYDLFGRVAVVAALVATSASDAQIRAGRVDRGTSLGAALRRSGVSDRRLARFLTTPASDRPAALRRVLMRTRNSEPIAWMPRPEALEGKTSKEKWDAVRWAEASRVHAFLFGSPAAVKRSADGWAAAFLRSHPDVTFPDPDPAPETA